MPSDLEDFADSLLIEGRVYNEHDQELFQERTGTASQSDLNSIESRTTTIETNLNTVTNDLSTVTADLDSLEETVNGIQVGDSYRVPNLADLPSTPNSTPATIYGSVYADSVSSDNNGRYYKEPGSSTWVKVPGDLTGRVVDLEEKTEYILVSPTDLMAPDGKFIDIMIRSKLSGRSPWYIKENGEMFSIHSHDNATSTSSGFMSALQAEKMNQVMSNDYLEDPIGGVITFMVRGLAGSSPLRVTGDGVTRMHRVAIGSIEGNLPIDTLGIQGNTISADSAYPEYSFIIRGRNKRSPFYINADGIVYAHGIVLPGQLPGSITTELLADESVTVPKLELFLQRDTAADYLPSMPDGVRDQLIGIGIRSIQSWKRFSERITPVIFGVNTTGTTLEFRPSSGMNVRGMRRVGTWSPGSQGSTNNRGQISTTSTWPPVGTFSAGDYYVFTPVPPATRVIGGDTLYQGDQMVWNGSTWLFQPSPLSGLSAFYELDFWEVTSGGVFAEVPVFAGDRFVYIGYNSISGVGWHRWRAGKPNRGEFFRMGDWNPASGFPAVSVNGDMYEVIAAGSVGGMTFAVGDTLYKTGGYWGKIEGKPIKSFANNEVINLDCIRSSREWEMRRADKSLTQVNLALSGYGTRIQFRGNEGIVVWGDSLSGQPGNILVTLFDPRSVVVHSYGGAKSRDILAMMEYWISRFNDPERAKFHVIFQGRNNINDLGTIQENADAMAALVGAGDGRLVFMTPGAQRVPAWDGTRYVIANMEQQFIEGSSNIYARAFQYFRDSWPANFLDSRALLCAAARSDYRSFEHPGMTERQVADNYGIYPIRYQRDIDLTGVDLTAINSLGNWSTAGLPDNSVGSNQDYYMRVSNGRPLVKVAGVWRDISYDSTHLNQTGDAGLQPEWEGGDNVLAAGVKTYVDSHYY